MAAAAGGAIRSSNLGRARTSERIVSGLRYMRPKGRSVDPEEANISRVENLSRKKEARSPARSSASWHLPAALHYGDFTRIPYAEAARRARLQDGIVYVALLALIFVFLIAFVRAFS
jgi:hypothetical protein